MDDRTSCEDCQQAFTPNKWDSPKQREAKAAGPPCGECRPWLDPKLRQAVEIYQLCGDQWVSSVNGALGLSIPAICDAMDREGVRDQRLCLRRVLTLARVQLDIWRSKEKKDKP